MSYRSLFRRAAPRRTHLPPIDTTTTIARPISVYTTAGRFVAHTKYHRSCRDAVRMVARTTDIAEADLVARFERDPRPDPELPVIVVAYSLPKQGAFTFRAEASPNRAHAIAALLRNHPDAVVA